jgi:secreted trypsin-like serine protease
VAPQCAWTLRQGTPAKDEEFPFIVQLLEQDQVNKTWQFICGGATVAEDVVLTAAHCVTDHTDNVSHSSGEPAQFLRVVAGTNQLTRSHSIALMLRRQNPSQVRTVKHVRIPEEFKYVSVNGIAVNDLALLELSQPFEFNALVQPISLPAQDQEVEGKVRLVLVQLRHIMFLYHFASQNKSK